MVRTLVWSAHRAQGGDPRSAACKASIHWTTLQYSLYSCVMERSVAIRIFESLSSGIRLDIYRLLVKRGLEGMVSGQIASALDLPPNNTSFHLKAMTQAGLLSVEQEGRFQRYRANIPLMLDLIGYLTEECCAGHPEHCVDLRAASPCAESVLPPISSTPQEI